MRTLNKRCPENNEITDDWIFPVTQWSNKVENKT